MSLTITPMLLNFTYAGLGGVMNLDRRHQVRPFAPAQTRAYVRRIFDLMGKTDRTDGAGEKMG